MLNTKKSFRIHYDVLGPKDAEVVCMTHSMTSDSGMWAEQVPALLEAGFRVVRIDMRGHGGSDAVDGDATLGDLANDVVTVLDGLSIQQVHYVGLSIGGMIGQKFALDYPNRLKSLLIADTAYTTLGNKKETAERMQGVKASGNLLEQVDGNMERRFGDAVKQRDLPRWTTLRETLLGTKIQGYLACMGAMHDFNFEKQLGSLKVPTMVVCGSDDASTTPEINRTIAKLIPGASYEEIAGGRHFPNVEFPERFNSILLGWLNRQRRAK